MTSEPFVPFFQGNVDQIRELQQFFKERDLATTPLPPPGGGGG